MMDKNVLCYTSTDSFIITDVKECDTDNGGCAHTCTEAAGSFSCICNPGYTLNDDDMKTCDGKLSI